ncbi:MAG: hypothetical protein AAF985_04665 [Bacteroidota bacterium]
MNLQQAKIILEKINRLYQSITLDSNVDIHEQELMLSYIRQFYTSFSGNSEDLKGASHRIVKPVQTTPVPPVSPPPVNTPPTPPPVPKVVKDEAPPVVPVVKKPVVEEAPKASTPPPVSSPAPAPKVVKKEAPIATTPPKPTPPKARPAVTKIAPKVEEEFETLFEHREAKELSDKLAQTPIRDLTKAISINEKILAVQELFDKDGDAYAKAIGQLNGFKNFDEAKPFLTQLAKTYKWTTKARSKKAKVFIKLIRRRYN